MSGKSIKTVCCTCLSTDRKLFPLYKLLDGINLLYMLLAHDPEAYKEGFYKDSASLIVCWECRATMCRIKRFQTQVCVAQKLLTDLANGRDNVKLDTFSHLKTIHNKILYEFHSEFITENFIDCGLAKDIKDESDSDDIPLAAFYSENDNNYEEISKNNSLNGNSNIFPDKINVPVKNNVITDNSNIIINNSNTIPDENIFFPENIDIIHEKSDIPDDVNIITDKIKKSVLKPTSRKKTKMKYKEYISISNMTEEEMIRSLEKRRNDLDKEAFKCDSCILNFKTENKVLDHNKNFHMKKDNTSQCDLCLSYIEDLPTHRQTHYHIYNCVLCTHITYTHTDMAKHFKKDHCDIYCENKKISKRKLKKLSLEPKYQCSECDLCFHNKDLRWKHIQKAHREGFKCSTCDKKFAFKNNLERHERIHKGPLPREECPTCHKMIRIDLLKVHSRIHTDRQTYTCVECDKHFVSRETYESHLKYAMAHATVDVCRHKCGICEKRYRSRGELRDHVNYQHNGKTEYKCPVCNKGLATKRCIRRHVRRAHEGIKESAKDKICQQCGKAFRDKKGLVEHERVHTGARPLACGACGRGFRQRAALRAHARRLHAS